MSEPEKTTGSGTGSGSGRWSDLAPRVGSAIVMVVVGLAVIWAGGDVFHLFVALICGAMVWELVRMLVPNVPARAVQLGALSAGAILLAMYLPAFYILPVLLAPSVAGSSQVAQHKGLFAVFSALIALAGFGMVFLRDGAGLDWMIWLICVVIATDVAGYFAGKMIGGAKLWPRVSPKKTWSGTVAGWIGAGLVGLIFAQYGGFGLILVVLSVLMSMVSQAGDIAESALKRKTGVKDSSGLIPGHGGLMDRFDGMLGASLFALLAGALLGLPAGVM
ncbi:MAG: phosphatidate cytidylyltransferase [Paracoccaceae bacterium]|jgi:phosphatidate cytidylyltransferase